MLSDMPDQRIPLFVDVNPAVLKWTRESCRTSFADGAAYLVVASDDLLDWEAGVSPPIALVAELRQLPDLSGNVTSALIASGRCIGRCAAATFSRSLVTMKEGTHLERHPGLSGAHHDWQVDLAIRLMMYNDGMSAAPNRRPNATGRSVGIPGQASV